MGSIGKVISPSDSLYAIGLRLLRISEEECLANYELELEMLRVDIAHVCETLRTERMRRRDGE